MRKVFFVITAVLLLTSVCFITVGNCQQKADPQYGGVLRRIMATGPTMMSYVPLMGPQDHSAVFPAGERLVDISKDRSKGGGFEPVLAEKVVEDPKGPKITWYIRKGIKFHDGTDLDAEAVRWNFQQIIDAKALPYAKFLKDMKVVDKYTLVMNLTEYSNQLVASWGWWPVITSKAAWDKASGGDLEKGKTWARTNIVGTGPFMLKEYKRDDHVTWVKNPNYWKKGRPYLDGIEVRIIPEPATARQLLEAKEADVWVAPQARDQVDLMKRGFKRQSSWPAIGYCLWINTSNAKSKWQDKRMREALEYAIDKEAITKALGSGLYRPLKSLPPAGEWGYDPNYNPRPYNPQKAKQLLAEAGYPNGVKIKLTVMFTPEYRDVATAIKQYLDAAGFQVDIDASDPGRFFGTIYNNLPGPDADIAWWMCTGSLPNFMQTYMRWFSSSPFTVLSFLAHPQEQFKMDAEAQKIKSPKEQEAMTKKLVRWVTDNAMVIPVFSVPGAAMQQPWVHSTEFDQGFNRFQTEDVWMEKH
jgi:peptide/nickel transport system substrate-binding protein